MAKKSPSRAANLTYATMAGQAGCLTIIIIFVALFVGLWLDSQTGTRGPFTIGLLLLSVPISLFAMVRIALSAIAEIQPQQQPKSRDDEDDAHKNNT